ncbi:hypothetical protein GCM10022409_15590 [Hymenobacter glaciei]|uniref:DUF2314 domain-containing protein n=1 Tax=Hymenobacter glaciei TaxID=877209 RepID=A0ABP7TWT3_9BACT
MRLTLFILLIIILSFSACTSEDTSASKGIYDVEAGDPEMLATMRKARATLPHFLAAVQQHDSASSNFAVKLPYADGDEMEYIWLGKPAFESGKWYGTVDNTPEYTHEVKEGERVAFDTAKVADWNYTKSGELIGGYSIRLLRNRMKPEERAKFDKSISWIIKQKAATESSVAAFCFSGSLLLRWDANSK